MQQVHAKIQQRSCPLLIITPHAIMYEGDVHSVHVTSALGAMGVRPGHEPLVAELRDGPVQFEDAAGKMHHYVLTDAMLHVTQKEIVIHAISAVIS